MDVKFGANETPAIDVQSTSVTQTATCCPPTPECPAPAPGCCPTCPPAPAPAAAPQTQTQTSGLQMFRSGASGVTRPNGLLLGDYIPEFKDIILPRINIAQNIGELGETFEVGTLLFNRDVPLFIPAKLDKDNKVAREATAPATMIVLGFRPTRFAEKVDGGGRGLIVNTEDEVRPAGGTTDYGEWKLKQSSGMKYFQPLADGLLLIKCPEGADKDGSVFVYEADGARWALALWGMKGTAYTALAKRVLFTARATGCLRIGGYPSRVFSLSTRWEQYPGGHGAWVPVAVPTSMTSPAMLAFASDILGGTPAAAQPAQPQ